MNDVYKEITSTIASAHLFSHDDI